MYGTHVKTWKKKFNEIKDFEKTPQLRVEINGVDTKRVKFSLPNSASEEEVVGDKENEDAKATEMMMKWKTLEVLSKGSNIPY